MLEFGFELKQYDSSNQTPNCCAKLSFRSGGWKNRYQYSGRKWVSEICSIVSDSLWPHGLYSPWNSPGQNTGVCSCSLLQGIFPTQGSNPGLLYCKWIIYQLNHKGSSRILEWVVYPISSTSSWPRNRTGVSCIKGRFFTNWAIREAPRREVDPIMLINSAVRWLHAEYKCLARVIT